MKIGWIADHFYPEETRGAELEDMYLIEEAIRRGHEIVKMGKLGVDVDVFVVANCVDNFNPGELLAFLSRRPYVRIEHDLRAPQMPFYRQLAGGAIINIYHSPLQEQVIAKVSGDYRHFLHPMYIPESFRDLGLERKPMNDVLYVGDYAKEKGYRNMEAWLLDHPDACIWHYGGGFEKKHPRMVEKGNVSQSEIVRVYNGFKSLIFLPLYTQACSRVIAEAYLCKVENIITNGNDGFTSYGFKPEDYDKVRNLLVNGHKRFWDVVEKEL